MYKLLKKYSENFNQRDTLGLQKKEELKNLFRGLSFREGRRVYHLNKVFDFDFEIYKSNRFFPEDPLFYICVSFNVRKSLHDISDKTFKIYIKNYSDKFLKKYLKTHAYVLRDLFEPLENGCIILSKKVFSSNSIIKLKTNHYPRDLFKW